MEQNELKNKKNTTKTGNLGESVACEYLIRLGYSILERNFWKKFGEIDIVALKDGKIHFVEVKTVTHETKRGLEWAVTHETWRPEELVHKFKFHQIEKALQAWVLENRWEGEWQIDVVALRLVPRETFASVNFIENVTEV